MPPGFFLECDLAYEATSQKKPLIDAGLVILPRREVSLERLIEKKRSEYGSVREKFEGLFDDERVSIFSDTEPLFVKRNTKIGMSATTRWEEGPDTPGTTWKHLKGSMSAKAIENARSAPRKLLEAGEALTWPALLKHLKSEVIQHEEDVRLYLQRNYFTLYVDEFELVVLRDLPFGLDEFYLPSDGSQYSYNFFTRIFRTLGLDWMVDLAPENIVQLKNSEKYIRFVDAYVQVIDGAGGVSNAISILGLARERSGFSAEAEIEPDLNGVLLNQKKISSASMATLVDGLDAIADNLEIELDLLVRSGSQILASESAGFTPWKNSLAIRRSKVGRIGGTKMIKTVVIATANQRETSAVLASIKSLDEQEDPKFEGGNSTLPRWEADLTTKKGKVKIAISQADETGGDEAVDLLRRISSQLNPDAVFFVGCAALLDEKAKPKENLVYLARRGIDSDKAELKNGQAYYDMEQHPGDLLTRRTFTNMAAGGLFEPVNLVTNRDFISGSVFLGDRKAKRRKDLVNKFPGDAVVLEMEAFQIYKELYRMRSSGETPSVAVSVLKGISDVGDEDAQTDKDTTQRIATMNAANVVLTYLNEVAG
ncbi:MAG: hypothetical protein ABJ251_18055 [Paracoccaceae bacterium]